MFSIATPSFRSLPVLKCCVGSVRNQAFPNLEHLVQDGASDDGTGPWLSSQDDVLGVSESDEGMYDAINRAWGRSSGTVLSWLNADEQYLPGTLEAVQKAFADHPDWDFLFGDALITLPGGEPLAARREIPLRKFYVLHGMLYSLSCTLFFRRRLYDRGWLQFDTQYKILGDYDLILRLLSRGARAGRISRYLALFQVDGQNLSLRPGVAEEQKKIRKAYGAGGRTCGLLAKTGRSVERVFHGCYRQDVVQYPLVEDEAGNSRQVGPVRTGFRFTYDRALKRLKELESR